MDDTVPTKDEKIAVEEPVIYENNNYQVIIIEVYQESAKRTVKCYGIKNKKTGVVEQFLLSFTQALTQATLENAVVENEWWKKQAAKEIDILHSLYEAKFNS